MPFPSAIPPVAVRSAQVILVECQRGEGELQRSVLQVWSPAGELLAEHDRIHPDPIWPACMARDEIGSGRWQVPQDAEVSHAPPAGVAPSGPGNLGTACRELGNAVVQALGLADKGVVGMTIRLWGNKPAEVDATMLVRDVDSGALAEQLQRFKLMPRDEREGS